MWVQLCLTYYISISTVWAQHTTRVSQDGTSFGWGWRLSPVVDGAGTMGQYYVNLPQSKQEVRYSADDGGYHEASSHSTNENFHTHSQHNVAIEQKAIELTTQPNQFQQKAEIQNASPSKSTRHPVDLYLLRQKYSTYIPQQTPPNAKGLTQLYNIQSEHNYDSKDTNIYDSKPLETKEANEHRTPLLQVFKDHNCSDKVSIDLQKDINKSKELFAQVPYQLHDVDELGNRPLSYTGTVKFRVEPPSADARNERFYYTTIETPVESEPNDTQQGIERLVASTQDLISNEDLLSLNHAAEKHVNEQSDDIIKPRPRWIFRHQDTDSQDSRNHITVKAKIENIVNSNLEHTENHDAKEQVLQTNSNDYKFAVPIFIPDPSYNNVRDQIVNNLVSTMVPYIANGYDIVGVRHSSEDNTTEWSDKEMINVTPRPISQNYLAPITVALRLLNNETTNLLDDHEASDSELILDTVQSPNKERTVVEIQESIPVDITHINDVEVHEYLDLGRNEEGSLDIAKSLYHKYFDALKSSKKIQDNMNKLLYKYGSMSADTDKEQEYETNDSLEPSENIHTEVEVDPNQNNVDNQRSESGNYNNDYNDHRKIIQPIIIEKEVPITQFVDRYIEKQVPYPQTVEVQVPVDRPVPIAVPYEKIVEKPVEVTRYIDKPYPVAVPRPYPVEVQVPYPVEHKIYIDRPIHIPYPVEKIIDRPILHPVPVPTPIGIPYEVKIPVEHKVFYPVQVEKPVPYPVEIEKPVERIVNKEVLVPYPVEKRVPYPVHYETKVPVPYPVEKRVQVPVERIIEKPVTVTKVVEKPVRVEVPVPQPVAVPVHVPHPYPVDRIVERKVPYPVSVDRIVEKKVHVNVPYPVEKIVEKPVFVTTYIDKPYPVERKVPYPVEKNVGKIASYPIQVPVQLGAPYPIQVDEKTVHAPTNIYRYANNEQVEESKLNPQYQKHEGRLKNIQDLTKLAQYYQLLKERQKVAMSKKSNQYASSYQYVNNVTGQNQEDKTLYFGPPPNKKQNDWWDKNKSEVEFKLRRADREPRVTNLRIEYGGFKPPLVPSTEVDIDGLPVNQGK